MKINFCLVCLKYDVKLYSFRNYSFGAIYSNLTRIAVRNFDQHVCYECASLLQKFQQFKLRCIRADKILSETVIMPEMKPIHLQTLQKRFNLTSNLGFTDIVTEDLTEKTDTDTECDDLNNDGIFISLSNYEEKLPFCINSNIGNGTQTYKRKEKVNEVYNNGILPDDISQDENSLSSEEDFNKPKANGITNEPYEFHTQNNNIDQQIAPEVQISTISSDNESCNSNSSWRSIFNTLNRIKYARQDLVSNNKENVEHIDSENEFDKVSPLSRKEISEIEKSVSENEFDKVSPLDRKEISEIEKSVGVKVKSITILVSNKTRKYNKTTQKQVENDKYTQKLKTAQLEQRKKTVKIQEKNLKKKFLNKYGTFEYMTQEQAKNDVLVRKDSANYRNSVFKCDLCFRGFGGKETFDNHMNKHNPALKGEYECDNCRIKFPTKRVISKHMASCHGWRFTCGYPGCSYVGYNMPKATNHVDLHIGKRKKLKCKYCGAGFNVENTLAGHIYKRHKDQFDVEFVCELCGRVFYNQLGFRIHKFKVHFNEKNDCQGPECKECNVRFATEQAWNLHLVLSRKHQVLNGCIQCGKTFESNYELELHMKEHRREVVYGPRPKSSKGDQIYKPESYICHYCSFTTKNDYFYKRHMHIMHGEAKPVLANRAKPFVCEICGAKYSASSLLKSHIWKHTGERPYKCRFCGKAFRLMLSLKCHENLHTRSDVYKCGVCDREFLWKPSLSRHIRLHLGNTPFKCLECGQSFVNLCSLKAHVRHKHEKVPYPQRKNPRYRKLKHWEPVAEENIETSIVN